MAKRDTKLKYLVCVGDLHAGSAFAPCPPTISAMYDTSVSASRVQNWLFDCWQHFTDEYVADVVGKEPFALVLNGDLKEGLHHGSKELVCVSENVHTRIAVERVKDRVVAVEQRRLHAVPGDNHAKQQICLCVRVPVEVFKPLTGISSALFHVHHPACWCSIYDGNPYGHFALRDRGSAPFGVELIESQPEDLRKLAPLRRLDADLTRLFA